MVRVDILLATYNGADYLSQQIESIIHGSFRDWRIIAHDDGSSDATVDILTGYSVSLGSQFIVVDDECKGTGAAANFFHLMKSSTADYIMFCDQDDRWDEDKVEIFVRHMDNLESHYGSDFPMMVCSDLRVVDQDLKIISDSLWKFQGLLPKAKTAAPALLVQPLFTGCAMMINKKLKSLALPAADDVIMHDWWLSLIASGLGHISLISRPTVDYRQHGMNVVGAKSTPKLARFISLFSRGYIQKYRDDITRCVLQAKQFQNIFGEYLTEPIRSAVECFAGLDAKGWMSRRICLLRYGILRTGLLRNMTLLLLV